jgi:glycine/D-amino acid oxidase-like deaminating enzyme
MDHFDYILVGQGVAGSALAVQLLQKGKKILVIDQPGQNRASRIAAGLFNPITGKKMSKTWMADTIFSYLHGFYSHVEELTGERFFYPMPLYRPFLSIEEQNEWMGRSAEPALRPYIDQIFVEPRLAGAHDPFGGLMLRQAGYIDTSRYMDVVRQWIRRDGTYEEAAFDEEDVVPTETGVRYRQWHAQYLLLCQGHRRGKWFDWLPIRPLKGETLMVNSALDSSCILNRGVYVVPGAQAQEFKVGATYDFQARAEGITPEARVELEEKLSAVLTAGFETIAQDWGVRPTVPDRRPILGSHPEAKNIVVFNGMGTKGISLAPYFSEILIRSLENGEGLNNDVDVNRYKSVYWKARK